MKKILLLTCTSLLLYSTGLTENKAKISNFSFIAISDLHVKDDGPGQQYPKMNVIKRFLSNRTNNARAVLMAGDLTDSGTPKQADNFENYWFNPLTQAMASNGGHVYASLGNHDKPGKKSTDIVDFVRDHCGDPYFYSFDIGDVHFACCYLHPGHWDFSLLFGFSPLNLINSNILLEADLLLNHDKKIVLFWHFDLKGAFSDWWTSTEKKITYELIKYYRILHVFVGHSHTPQFTSYWEGGKNDPKIPVSLVGGNYFAYCAYADNALTVNFMDKDGNTKTWNDMYRKSTRVKQTLKKSSTSKLKSHKTDQSI